MWSLSFTRFAPLRTASVLSLAATLCAFVAAPRAAHAQSTISTLFNTGVDASNTLLAGGDADPHYTMIANDVGLTNGTSALVDSAQLDTTYAQNPTSKYISPDGGDGSTPNVGVYTMTYRTTFTLPANTVLSSVNIVGDWSTDNVGNDILVNGHSTGFSSSDYGSFIDFALPTTFYKTGTNTLDYVWADQGAQGAINVYYTAKTYNIASSAAPEPGAMALMGAFLLPVAGLVVRRRVARSGAAA